jgi:two-component system sensor histidine kinase RpfC
MTKPIQVPKLLDTLAAIASNAPAASQPAASPDRDYDLAPKSIDDDSVLQELAAMGMGDKFLRDFVDQCLRDIGRSMSQLQVASRDADYDEMRESAHAMRGVAENLGAIRLVERCRMVMRLDNLELARQANNLTKDLDQLVEQTAREVLAQLPKLLGGDDSRQDSKPGPEPG